MSRQILVCSVTAILTVFGAAATAQDAPPAASGRSCPTVVRAYFSDRAMVEEVATWTEPWEVRYDDGYLVVGVDPDGYQRLLAAGFRLEVDERRTRRACEPLEPLEGQTRGIPGYLCYRTVEETFTTAQNLAAAHPDLAQWVDAGDSWEKTDAGGLDGYDMGVLVLTNVNVVGTPPAYGSGKPKLFVTSAIHARELTTAELMTRFAELLVNGYGIDPDATWLLDEHEIHLMLHTNPDGRKHAETGDWWRKNTNENYCGATSPDRGADLNRNFEFQWGCCGGSSGAQCDETYRGPTPASEPEIQAAQAHGRAIFPDQRDDALGDDAPLDATGVYIDMHSYQQLVMWPWGFTSTPPANATGLQTLGRKMAYFNGYTPEQSIGLYPTDGTSNDFYYGDLGVAAYVIELGTDFFQDCATFESTILPDNLEVLLMAAKAARTPYMTPAGPEAYDATVVGASTVEPGTPVDVTVVLDDARFSTANGIEPSQNVTLAQYFVDLPPWDGAAAAYAMTAVDGSFNSNHEVAQATVSTTGLAQGQHALFFRGRDANNNWGPVTSLFFWVLDPATAPRIAGTVFSSTGVPLQATVQAAGFSTVSSPVDGSYSLMVVEGTYDVTASAPDHASVTETGVVAVTGSTTPLSFLLPAYTNALFDDVENGNALGWTAQSPWAITELASASPTHSWTDSPSGNYAANVNTSLTSPVLDLSAMSGCRLEFMHTYQIESGWDFGYVEYSTNGGSTWSQAAAFTGSHTSWGPAAVDLPQLDGVANARFRFRLVSDSYTQQDGWYVDDIYLRGFAPQTQHLLSVTKSGPGTGTVTSDPAGIDCGSTCSALFATGTVVTLSAVPDAGSLFLRWDGAADCADGEVTLDQAMTCTAVFDLESAVLFADGFESGDTSAWSAVVP